MSSSTENGRPSGTEWTEGAASWDASAPGVPNRLTVLAVVLTGGFMILLDATIGIAVVGVALLTSLGPAGADAAPRDAAGQEALARAYTHATQVALLYALGALVLTALLVPFLPRRTPREGQAS